jgi:hydrogenase expression/formation protein HypC
MCLGLPGRITELQPGSHIARVEVAGAVRDVNVGILDGSLCVGDHILIHSGFALERLTPEQARDALAALGGET